MTVELDGGPTGPEVKKAAWITALRDGQFKQCRGAMANNYSKPTSYCCLGVAAVIADFEIGLPAGELPYSKTRSAYAIGQAVSDKLVQMNDTQGRSFAEIADWIETHDLQTGELLSSRAVARQS